MENGIILEDITNESYRIACGRLIYLSANRHNSYLINIVCTTSKFDPDGFMDWYKNRRTFSDKQLSFINGVYGKVEAYRTANKIYSQEGYRNELIELMEQVAEASETTPKNVYATKAEVKRKINELQKGQMIYTRYFRVAKNCLKVVPKKQRHQLSDRLNVLKDKFWEIYNEIKAQPQS